MKRIADRMNRSGRLVRAGQSSRAVVDRLEPRSYLSAAFGTPTFYSGVTGGVGIASGDFNGDGMPDVVVSGLNSGATSVPVVGVYLDAKGSFGKPTVLPFNGTPSGVAVGHFTNNGKTDIAVVDSTTNSVVLFLGSGSGNFIPSVGAGLAGQGGATSIAVGDWNGDHFDDIAVVEPTLNQVEIQFGKGNGSFAAESTVPVPSVRDVFAADVNGDGHPDLVITSGNGSVYVALNTGGGNFVAPTSYSLGSSLTSINDLIVADVNGDSLPDLVAVGDTGTGATAGTIAVLLNQGGGTGTFGTPTNIATTIDPVDVVPLHFTDTSHLNLGIVGAAGALDILPGNGDGTFAAAQAIFDTQLVPPLGSAVAADLNGDGLSDIAFVSPSQMGIGVILNTTNGSVTPPVVPPVVPPVTPPLVTPSPLVPVLAGKLPSTPLVAGGKIAPIHEIVTLTNNSDTAVSGSITLNLVLATTPAGETGDPVIATVTKMLTIKAHKGKKFVLSAKSLPAGIAGPRYVLAEVTDPSSMTNLVASAATISIVAPMIDLSGAFITRPTTARVGRNASITFSVTNTGTTAVNQALPIQLQTSATAGIDSTSAVIDSFAKKVVIKPGKTVKYHVSKVISKTAGSYYIIVQLDPNNTLGDVNPGNNTIVTGSAIVVS